MKYQLPVMEFKNEAKCCACPYRYYNSSRDTFVCREMDWEISDWDYENRNKYCRLVKVEEQEVKDDTRFNTPRG